MELEISKDSANVLYGIAFRFYQGGKFDQAEHFFRFLTLTDPMSPKNWIGLGASLQMSKKYEEAIESYAAAGLLDVKDENPYLPFYAAQCYHSLGKLEQGIKALNAVLNIAKDKEKYQSLLSQVSFLTERWMEVN